MGRLNNQKGKVRVPFAFGFPIFEGLYILLLIHIFTWFPYFLIVNDINIGAFFIPLFDSSCNLFQAFWYESLIFLFFITKGKQSNFFIIQEIHNIFISPLPLWLAHSFKYHSIFTVWDKYCIPKFLILHAFEKSNITDSSLKRSYFDSFLAPQFLHMSGWPLMHKIINAKILILETKIPEMFKTSNTLLWQQDIFI